MLSTTPMNQILTLEISEQVFTAMQLQAAKTGVSPELLAAILIEKQVTSSASLPVDEVIAETACLKFERHFGTLPESKITVDNESVDADLAREYANNNHE